MKTIILVSHSEKVTEGLKEMIDEMVGTSEYVKVHSAGGTGDGRLGTNTLMVSELIESSSDSESILIFADIGSAIMCSETAIELLGDEKLANKTHIVDAPLVEGSFAAAVMASTNASLDSILEEIKTVDKIYL